MAQSPAKTPQNERHTLILSRTNTSFAPNCSKNNTSRALRALDCVVFAAICCSFGSWRHNLLRKLQKVGASRPLCSANKPLRGLFGALSGPSGPQAAGIIWGCGPSGRRVHRTNRRLRRQLAAVGPRPFAPKNQANPGCARLSLIFAGRRPAGRGYGGGGSAPSPARPKAGRPVCIGPLRGPMHTGRCARCIGPSGQCT